MLNARRRREESVDDGTLAHRVESELFRRARVPKGQIDINAEDGVVFLRGVAGRPEEIARIEEAAQRIPGVRSVESLLHLPGTPAPASRPRRMRERAGT
jgi:osmotically-inducible protein OsmY